MAEYGQYISAGYEIDNLYTAIDNYYNHPDMFKIKDVENGYSVYMTKLYCLLSRECRYLVAIVPYNKDGMNTSRKLKDLEWVSFQTRTLEDNHDIPMHSYTVSRLPELMSQIIRTEQTEEYSLYKCSDFPCTVTLLQPKNSAITYQPKGTVIAALETFQTIITLSD